MATFSEFPTLQENYLICVSNSAATLRNSPHCILPSTKPTDALRGSLWGRINFYPGKVSKLQSCKLLSFVYIRIQTINLMSKRSEQFHEAASWQCLTWLKTSHKLYLWLISQHKTQDFLRGVNMYQEYPNLVAPLLNCDSNGGAKDPYNTVMHWGIRIFC